MKSVLVFFVLCVFIAAFPFFESQFCFDECCLGIVSLPYYCNGMVVVRGWMRECSDGMTLRMALMLYWDSCAREL
ncbi:hypothetical protein CC80DRAFT_30362 [Byssothecium circinans]|uniref:Extracellular membrane protein CFEM domain-containing protein n=1 Tax=Byssothecium circinans TaxID=147558 RepID=A0A6A5U0H7_9PLEO|nr:hypothetical protein CC80DRAFT_30362 [Byssothecium circinans]